MGRKIPLTGLGKGNYRRSEEPAVRNRESSKTPPSHRRRSRMMTVDSSEVSYF